MSVKIENLNIVFGETHAVKNFNLTAGDGEFVVILGPSGSGKTSVLRTIAGLISQDSGDISIDGRVVNDVYPSDRDVAMVFQNYALYPHMTVYDNIALNLRMKKFKKEELDKKVRDVSVVVGIEQLLKRKPRELSGGQAQRVGLARAMVRDPAVYLMDEPLSSLDAKFREEMRDELRRFHKITGKTIIYVTHDQVEAMSLSDKIVVMNQGEKIQEGEPRELYDNPEHSFVAGFVGSPPMNIFPVTRTDKASRDYRLSIQDVPASFSVEIAQDLEDDDLEIGMRPNDLVLDSKGAIEAVLQGTEFLGPVIQVHVTIGTSRMAITLPRTIENEKLISSHPGSLVRFSIDPEKVYVFRKEDGSRLKVAAKSVSSSGKGAEAVAEE